MVYRAGKTEILLSGETVDEMRKYAELLGSVYGDLRCEKAEPLPAFLREQLPGKIMHC